MQERIAAEAAIIENTIIITLKTETVPISLVNACMQEDKVSMDVVQETKME